MDSPRRETILAGAKVMRLVFLVMLLGVSLKAQSEMTILEMKLGQAARVHCTDSLPHLSGNVLTCEVTCETQVIKTWDEEEVCDQVCWKESRLRSVEVKVTKQPGRKTVFEAKTTIDELTETLVEAQTAAGGVCTRLMPVEHVSK